MEERVNEYVNKNDPAFLYFNLHPDEQIKLIIRHHWGGFLGTLLITFAMAAIPLLLIYSLSLVLGDAFSTYRMVIIVAISAYLLFLETFLFGTWINYYYDIIIVTNERMVNVNQTGLLSREVSELGLRVIQNVTSQQEGFLQSWLDYGRLVVETAGEGTSKSDKPGIEGYFTIEDVPNPRRIARAILDMSRQLHEKQLEEPETKD